jgi:hypothetical protein
MDILAASGLGSLGIKASQTRMFPVHSVDSDPFDAFDDWADELWDRCKPDMSLSAVRTRVILNLLYPSEGRFLRLKIIHRGTPLGWVVLRDTQMHDHKHFGSLRLGTIVDAMAAPDAMPVVVETATRILEMRGVDLTISNQGHESWVAALQRCGFRSAPSNFIFAMSPQMAALLTPMASHQPRLHINRGDGDGPLEL